LKTELNKSDYIILIYSILLISFFFSFILVQNIAKFKLLGPSYDNFIYLKHHSIMNVNIDLNHSCQFNNIVIQVLNDSETNWWESAWVWAAISALVAIILRIIKFIYDYRKSKKSGRRYRKNG